MNKNIKLLFIGRLISHMGDGIFIVALPLYFLSNTSSLIDVGLFFMLVKIPSMILTPYIGIFVERINKKTGIVVSDFLSGILFTVLAVLLYLGASNIVIFITISAIYQVFSSVFSISSAVLFTHLTTDDNRLKVNGYKSLLDNAANLLAPTLGAILFLIFGIEGIVLINAVSFLISVIFELFIQYDHCLYSNKNNNENDKISLGEYKLVFEWLKSHRNVFNLLLIVMVLNFFVAPNDEIMFPTIVVRDYAFSDSIYGISITLLIIGNLCASFMLTKFDKIKEITLKNLFVIESSVLIAIGVSANLLSNISSSVFLSFYLCLMFLAGFFITLVNVPLITEFQTKVPVSMQGKFFALLSLVSHFLIPLGVLFAGISSEVIGADNTLIVNNIIVIIFVIRFASGEKKGIYS